MATIHQMMSANNRLEAGSQKFCDKPCLTAISKVRRNLFGSVDHSESLSLVEQELKVQSIIDSERWGFDFHLELPLNSSRFDWQPFSDTEFLPKLYNLRSMKYLGKQASSTINSKDIQQKHLSLKNNINKSNKTHKLQFLCIDNTKFGQSSKTNQSFCAKSKNCSNQVQCKEQKNVKILVPKKQCVITDFMKKRKKPQNIYVKSISKSLINVPQTSDSKNMRT